MDTAHSTLTTMFTNNTQARARCLLQKWQQRAATENGWSYADEVHVFATR